MGLLDGGDAMSKIRDRAREIFRRESKDYFPLCPYGRHPSLDDLWPELQEEYEDRALDELKRET